LTKAGFEPTSSDYEPDKLPITLSRLKIYSYRNYQRRDLNP